MYGLIWIASYPKSGSTWLRVLLANYDAQTRVDINRLSIPNAAGFVLFDRFSLLEPNDLANDQVQRLRPALFRDIARHAREPMVFKVHDAFGPNGAGEPIFPADITERVLYLIRNPLDVALSASRHFGLTIDAAVASLCSEFTLGSASQCVQRVGSWSAHVNSWLESGLPISVFRYEDLLADSQTEFARMLSAMGRPVDDDRVALAVEHSRFERLQEQERTTGFVEQLAEASGPFFASGTSGAWRTHLTDRHVRLLVDAHRDVMGRFGYVDEDGNPF